MVAAAIPPAAQGKPIELWWQDEARVGQQGSLTRIWAERGSRPTALRDQRYKWAYLFGAVCPARDVGAGLVLPHANVHAMNLHLQEISTQVSQGAFAVLTLDGAGWHQMGDRLVLPNNIGLLHLPPYSPCPRRGRASVGRLMHEHGPDMPIPDLLALPRLPENLPRCAWFRSGGLT